MHLPNAGSANCRPTQQAENTLLRQGHAIATSHLLAVAFTSVLLRMYSEDNGKVAGCPVDHKSREAWLRMSSEQREVADQSIGEQIQIQRQQLRQDREISSIPRTLSKSEPTSYESDSGSGRDSTFAHQAFPHASNSESQEAHTSTGGHWIYPSEEMFFNAMRRKNHQPKAKDMHSIIPIHNAVNERTWQEILRWERPHGSFEQCGGPRLTSFAGDSKKLTPRARLYSLLGYQPPFDRHDWAVDRCGVKVDYVIDFYQGKGSDGKSPLNFYLDVRPKLNSIEGWRMRFLNLFWP